MRSERARKGRAAAAPVKRRGGARKRLRMARQDAQGPRDLSMFARMLSVVRRIPWGKVATYGDVAYVAGYPGSARQVAWALHQDSRGLPWHRVVGADGRILLSGESGFEQRMRLHAEGVEFAGLRVKMDKHRHGWFTGKKKRK